MFLIWIIFFLILLYLFSYVRVVSHNHVVVCHTFGYKFTRILKSGIHLLYPHEFATFYQWTNDIYGTQLKLINSYNIEAFECSTCDNKVIITDFTIFYKILDPYKAIFSTANALSAVVLQFKSRARNEIRKHSNILKFGDEICSELCFTSEDYGIQIERVYIK